LRIQISSTGIHLPDAIETSAELSKRVGRSEAWIHSRTGVHRRHITDAPIEAMAAAAVRDALGDGDAPDLLINASLSPRQLIPDTSVFILRELGISGIPSFSIHATCLGFLVALQQVAALICSGQNRRVAVVAAERGSMCRDFSEPESAVLIVDGAGAAIVEPTPEGSDSEILGFKMATFPEGAHLAELRGFGAHRHPDGPDTEPADNCFHMKGPSIYRMAIPHTQSLLGNLLDELGLTIDDIDLVVPHQASGPALRTLSRFGIPEEKVVNMVADWGNCIAASLPMALAHAHATGRIKRGDLVLLLGTGAGLSVAGMVLRW